MYSERIYEKKELLNELAYVDLRDNIRNVRTPYHIIQGELDVVTSTKTIEKFVQDLQHDNLTCTVVKNAAHSPGVIVMNMIMDEIGKLCLE